MRTSFRSMNSRVKMSSMMLISVRTVEEPLYRMISIEIRALKGELILKKVWAKETH